MLEIFDGHNDTVQRIKEYSPDGVDFLDRSTAGHLDLPRAEDGGLIGGLFAMFVRPEPPANSAVVSQPANAVRSPLAIPMDHAKREVTKQLSPR